MALTPTLVFAKPNHVRYSLVATVGSGESATIVGPALLAALKAAGVQGPITQIFNVATAGYGLIAAGTTITQAIARALLCSDNAVATIGANVPTAFLAVEQRTGTGTITADATQDASVTSPAIVVGAPAAGAASAYLDIYIPGAIGV